jgi:hypothetical protein
MPFCQFHFRHVDAFLITHTQTMAPLAASDWGEVSLVMLMAKHSLHDSYHRNTPLPLAQCSGHLSCRRKHVMFHEP